MIPHISASHDMSGQLREMVKIMSIRFFNVSSRLPFHPSNRINQGGVLQQRRGTMYRMPVADHFLS
jgi:hypothetical protein